jgi:ribosome-associated protein
MRAKKVQKAIVAALEDIKAREIEVIDVSKLTAMFDFVVIATADSGRQARALAMHVQDAVKQAGGKIYGMEGEQTDWVLVDCGDTVVHVMLPAAREHYNLEQLWQPKRAPRREDKAVRGRTKTAPDGGKTARAASGSVKKRPSARTSQARGGAKTTRDPSKVTRKPRAIKRGVGADQG